jgi:hypothetical protein
MAIGATLLLLPGLQTTCLGLVASRFSYVGLSFPIL